MLLTLIEATSSVNYYKEAHPEDYTKMGGDKITSERIIEALEVASYIAGGIPHQSEDELFRQELTRICNATTRD